MTSISRRQFIITAVATSAVSFGFKGCSNDLVRLTPTPNASELDAQLMSAETDPVVKTVAEFLAQELNYLKVRKADLLAFAREFQTREGKDRLQDQYKKEPEKIENRLVTQFLMSSNFFWNNADESQPVKYLTYYDPYNNSCSNPFARFD